MAKVSSDHSAGTPPASDAAENSRRRVDAEHARYVQLFAQLREELFGVSQRFSAGVVRRIRRGNRSAKGDKGQSLWVTLLTEATNVLTGTVQRKPTHRSKRAETPATKTEEDAR